MDQTSLRKMDPWFGCLHRSLVFGLLAAAGSISITSLVLCEEMM